MPTIWVGQRYKEMLPAFEVNSLFGEVILIDNDTTKTDKDVFKYSKLVYLPQKENIYVNPAWNLGVKNAKYDVLCFANDDIAIDLSFLDEALKYVKPEYGMLGLGEKTIRSTSQTLLLSDMTDIGGSTIAPTKGQDSHYATFFFIHKDSYFEIPEDLKVYYGDTYNFNMNKHHNKQNHQLIDGKAVSMLRTTSRLFRDVITNDRAAYEKYKNRWGE